MTHKDEPKVISGEIIPKENQPSRDNLLPTGYRHQQPSVTLSFIERLKSHANKKAVEALADLEEAKARYERAVRDRMENQELGRRQLARLSDENLNAMAEAESASIRAELSDSYRREQEALSALERQKARDQIEDMKLELERRDLETKLNPPKQPKRHRKKHVNPKKRKADEIERLLKYGTLADEGAILEAQLTDIRKAHGDDESAWPPEIQEKVRAARMHVLRKTTPGTP